MTPDRCDDLAKTLAAVHALASIVPDPELVVVSVGDLGILRDVRAVL